MKLQKIAAFIGAVLLCANTVSAQEKVTVRFGHFPNITHAQGVVAHAF